MGSLWRSYFIPQLILTHIASEDMESSYWPLRVITSRIAVPCVGGNVKATSFQNTVTKESWIRSNYLVRQTKAFKEIVHCSLCSLQRQRDSTYSSASPKNVSADIWIAIGLSRGHLMLFWYNVWQSHLQHESCANNMPLAQNFGEKLTQTTLRDQFLFCICHLDLQLIWWTTELPSVWWMNSKTIFTTATRKSHVWLHYLLSLHGRKEGVQKIFLLCLFCEKSVKMSKTSKMSRQWCGRLINNVQFCGTLQRKICRRFRINSAIKERG